MHRLSVLAIAGACLLTGCGYSTSTSPHASVAAVSPNGANAHAAAKPSPPISAPGTSSNTNTAATPRPAATQPATSQPATAQPAASQPAAALPNLAGSPLVALDPGHNGGSSSHLDEINRLVPAGWGTTKPCNTTGTNTDAGYPEHAFNFDVALRVKKILITHGVRVIMTRSNDTGVGPCVNERAAIQSTRGVVASIAIHADGAPESGHGFHVNEDSRIPDGATAATLARSNQLGTDLHNALAANSGLVPSTYIGNSGYVYRDDFAGLNLCTVPASFLELGNMRNPGDAALQTSAVGRQRIADAIAAGILTYLAHR